MSNVPSSFRIAVLASTRGTDLQAIIDALKMGKLPNVELACVVSNKKNCYALERARLQGYKTYFIASKARERGRGLRAPQSGSAGWRGRREPLSIDKSRIKFDREMADILKKESVNLVVLVGYMRILTPYFVGEFRGRIINVHPALIPKYSGKEFFGNNVHEAVLKSGDSETGMTIHFVDENVDTGAIIVQKKCPVHPGDTPETLKKRVQELEKEWYPKVIRMLSEGEG